MNPLSLIDGPMSGSSSATPGIGGSMGYSNTPITTSTATGQATTNAGFTSGDFVIGGGSKAPATNYSGLLILGGLMAASLWFFKGAK